MYSSNMLKNSSASTSKTALTSAATTAALAASVDLQPKVVIIQRRPNQGFGFTLRHFIAYPPEDDTSWAPQEAYDSYQVKAMETIFIKEVHANGPAHYANLKTGDRVLMVNNISIAGIPYSKIVSMIKQTPLILTLHVVPKECDVLQMHYTNIAHTPESNRLTANMSTTVLTSAAPQPILSSTKSHSAQVSRSGSLTSANGCSNMGLRALHGSDFAGSINFDELSETTPDSLSLSHNIHHYQQQHQLPQAFQHYNQQLQQTLPIRSSDTVSGCMRVQPSSNVTVLAASQQHEQQQLQQQLQQTSNFYSPGVTAATTSVLAPDNNDLMIRLRESIKQKEEFLKSPVPHAATLHHQHPSHCHQQQFFPHTPSTSGSPQLSMVSTSTSSIGGGSSSIHSGSLAITASKTQQQQQQHCSTLAARAAATINANAPRMYDQQLCTITSSGGNGLNSTDYYGNKLVSSIPPQLSRSQRQLKLNGGGNSSITNVSALREKYSKDFDYLETLQETGVTNRVFESKLASHMSKGFDPFKPLSINTNAIGVIESQVAPGNVMLAKKPGVLYDSLQHHPLHQQQVQQLQQQSTTTMPHHGKVQYAASLDGIGSESSNVVDGQQSSRMEIYKATLANTIINEHLPHPPLAHVTNKVPETEVNAMSVLHKQQPQPQHLHKQQQQQGEQIHQTPLKDIAESNVASSLKGGLVAIRGKPNACSGVSGNGDSNANGGVIRRFKSPMPLTSFDDGSKPMRRISYLRATNNEHDYQSDTATIAQQLSVPTSTTIIETSTAKKEYTTAQQHAQVNLGDEKAAYDVVGVGNNNDCGLIVKTLTNAQLVDNQRTSIIDKVGIGTADVCAEDVVVGSNFAIKKVDGGCDDSNLIKTQSVCENNELKNSNIYLDSLKSQPNGKMEMKDVATEMEIFETEMEIKSNCINGKRLSEYRSWRQVKIEIIGDVLKIYPSRHSKTETNVIELDIKNCLIFDESSDKKKFIFRIQTKPNAQFPLADHSNLDADVDKLTLLHSGTSAVTEHNQQQQAISTCTDILFKTKSQTEMKRIVGLLQWKNSLIFEKNDLCGKQLAEPQKMAAITSMPTLTYCDNVQQQQHLQAEYSPLSSVSHGELEASTSASATTSASASASASDSISPVMKTRKSSSHKNIPDKDLGSPKAKNWKDLLFRRGGGGSSNQNTDVSPFNLASNTRMTGSIGVPLKLCPMSKDNEYVPNIVDVCTNIVETKGLSVVGIYRIPGNKAAISELSDQVNKNDFTWERCNADVRWEDVNVVSSLLKLFIRSLPDALLPSTFYNHFIEADKKTGLDRLTELKELLHSLPRYSYETMKHLIRHLHRVSKNCDVNLMEPKNLAIIFGPSIIRTPNDTLEIAVKDMKHQCRIVELLVTQYEYFFENGNLPELAEIAGNVPSNSASDEAQSLMAQSQLQTNMLLHNVSKIERLTTERDPMAAGGNSSSGGGSSGSSSRSRFIPQLRRRGHGKRSSDTYSGESVLSVDYLKASTVLGNSSGSSTNTTIMSTSDSSSLTLPSTIATTEAMATTKAKQKEHDYLTHSARLHQRNDSIDEKDSVIALNEQQRNNVGGNAHVLTDDEESSNNSHISDSGSMSLTTVTETFETKLNNLRNGSCIELSSNVDDKQSNDVLGDDGAPKFPLTSCSLNRRHTFGQPLHLPADNIPYADESPERHFYACPLDAPNTLMLSRSCTATHTLLSNKADKPDAPVRAVGVVAPTMNNNYKTAASNKLQHSATVPINSNMTISTLLNNTHLLPMATGTTSTSTTVKANHISSGDVSLAARNSAYACKNIRFSTSVYDKHSTDAASDDDSEGSTTSDPNEALLIASPSWFFVERYNKMRRDHRLFRSASFNSRNSASRHAIVSCSTGSGSAGGTLTKDEKTDMNLTKKRQIQNKQNRSIKRRHTVGGTHDYVSNNCGNHLCKGGCSRNNTSGTTTSSTPLRRLPIPSGNVNISNNINKNNIVGASGGNGEGNDSVTITSINALHSDGKNGNSTSGSDVGGSIIRSEDFGVSGGRSSAAVISEHALDVGLRKKNSAHY